MDWVEFNPKGKLPVERRKVLVMVPERESENCKRAKIEFAHIPGDPNFCDLPATVAVGYLRIHSDGPFFVVPGVGGPVTHWCDCLGDDFKAPLWQSQQVIGEPKHQWFKYDRTQRGDAFIAHSRADIPFLLAKRTEDQARIAELEKLVGEGVAHVLALETLTALALCYREQMIVKAALEWANKGAAGKATVK